MLSTKLKEAAGNSSNEPLYSNDVFSTYLYTGNGSTQTITNGIDLAGKGGMVWIKSRNLSESNVLYDTARGVNQQLQSNNFDGSSNSANTLTAFNSTGFTLGTNRTDPSYNYASWTFRKAAKFFDVVTYTGTGSARTIAHSLGVAPGMVIVKRTDTTGNWQVYSNGLTSAAYSIQLNLTDAQASAPAVWNSTAPTSSVFSVGTDATVNASGGTYVAYLYAHDTSSTGIIQCGSFTRTFGTANSVNLGYEPQWVLIKCTSQTGSWQLYDTMRGLSQTASLKLEPNSSNPESNTAGMIPTATGFDITATGIDGGTFIYMAIRMPNKPPTTGTQVFLPTAFTSNSSGSQVIPVGFPSDMALVRERTTTGNFASQWPIGSRLTGNGFLRTTLTNSEVTFLDMVNGWDDQNNLDLAGIIVGNGNFSEILYNFKRAPGFFDVVCYTGTGLAPAVTHNLGVVPELIIQKNRNGGEFGNWFAFNATQYLKLNLTDAAATYSSAITSTTFQPVSQSGGTNYVAYLFATLAGISKVGSYTGNGTGQAIACGFSAGARFVLIKRTDSTGDWYTFDSARGLTSGSSPYLLLNSTAAEVTGNNGVYASTGGFTLGSTASTTTNISGASYIFLSVA